MIETHSLPGERADDALQLPISSTFPGRARLVPREASEYLFAVYGVRVAQATLAKLRCIGGGPHFQRFGRSILYPRGELDTWAIERLGGTLRNTSQ